MAKSDSTLIAIGGGDVTEAEGVLELFLELLKKKNDERLVVMTVATDEPENAARKYRSLFGGRRVRHVSVIDVSDRNDGFDNKALKKIEASDALFFTGGDQLNVTSLMGGSPLHDLIHEKFNKGFLIAGTSAGAAMMSTTMIISGGSGNPPMVGGVEFAPGLGLIPDSVIDTHFSQRARHGRLLTAVAHYPQAIGLGIDERTALVYHRGEFRVVGNGIVTVVDGSEMQHCDLPYMKKGETIGMFGARISTLSKGYRFKMRSREPIAPTFKQLAGAASGG